MKWSIIALFCLQLEDMLLWHKEINMGTNNIVAGDSVVFCCCSLFASSFSVMLRDAILHTFAGVSVYLGYCCLISSKQFGHFPLTSVFNGAILHRELQLTGDFLF